MNRYEPQDTLAAQRPPRRRLWLWLPLVVLLAVGVYAGIGAFPIIAFQTKGFPAPPPASVSTAKAVLEEWMPQIEVVGTFQPVRGADLSVEVPGIIDQVSFDSGGDVAAGAQIIKLRDSDDVAKLRTLEANRDLAKSNFDRDKAQLDRMLISRAQFDVTAANLQALRGSGRRAAGDHRQEDAARALRGPARHPRSERRPIYQPGHQGRHVAGARSDLSRLLPAPAGAGAGAGRAGCDGPRGHLSARDLQRDGSPRSIPRSTRPRATSLFEPHCPTATAACFRACSRLLEIQTGQPVRYITLPQTAITFNPYGNMVFRVTEEADKEGKQSLIARQTVVTTGQTRGDQIAVLSGLNEGDLIVSSGQTKLQNGATITVNNAVQPSNDPNPQPRER